MSVKVIEPELGIDSFSCPHCHAIAHQTWFHLLIHEYGRRDERPFVFGGKPDIDPERFDEREAKALREFVYRLEKNTVTYRNHTDSQYSSAEMANLNLSRCFSCEGFAVWVEDTLIYPVRQTAITHHEDMPPEIKKDFEEAASIVNQSPRAAAALLRLCIQS